MKTILGALTLAFLGAACGEDGVANNDGSAATGSQDGARLDAPQVSRDAASVDAAAADAGSAQDSPPASDLAVDMAPPIAMVFSTDLETAIPTNLAIGNGVLTPSQGFAPLGPPGNTFGPTFLRSPTGNSITLTLENLPPHKSLSIEFLFAAIDSLDGTGTFPAGDFFVVTLDGQPIFRESFANALESQIQSYMPPPGVVLARRVDLGFQGPGGYYTDSAYDLGADPTFRDLPHAASTATLVFTLEGAGVQSVDDESWAIDNIRVLLGQTPKAPTPDAGGDR